MQKGVCHLTCIPMRLKPSGKSEMVSMLLYGDQYYVKQVADGWAQIATVYDEYEGWINEKQINEVESFTPIFANTVSPVSFLNHPKRGFITLSFGSSLTEEEVNLFQDTQFLRKTGLQGERDTIVKDAYKLINAPYLWGGKSIMGVDCSGYAQTVFKVNDIKIKRDAYQQAEQGQTVELTNAQPGDLAFFDNKEGKIVHVGIVLPNNLILHAHNSVRIDKLTEQGILDIDRAEYSHQLHSIKSYL